MRLFCLKISLLMVKRRREITNKSDQAKLEGKSDLIAMKADSGIKLEPPKILGVSLIDCFTVEELKEHLSSLRQCTDMVCTSNFHCLHLLFVFIRLFFLLHISLVGFA